MANILVIGINYSPEPTGSAPYTSGLAEMLAECGHNVEAFVGIPHYPWWKVLPADKFRLRSREVRNQVFVRHFRHFVPNKQTMIRRIAWELTFLLNVAVSRPKSPPDLVICSTPSLSGSLLGVLFSKKFRVPLITFVQDVVGQAVTQSGLGVNAKVGGLVTKLEQRVFSSSNLVCVVSPNFNQYVSKSDLAPDRIVTFPNWSHIRLPTKSKILSRLNLGWPDEQIIVLYTGNMGLKQDLGNVIETAKHFAENPLFKFVLCGDGSQKGQLLELASGVSAVSYMEPVSEEEYPNLLLAADILIVNERDTVGDMSLPSKLTSYLTVGKPIIAAVAMGGASAQELSQTDGAAIIVPAGNPKRLAFALIELAKDPKKMVQMSKAAQTYAAKNLSRDSAKSKIKKIVDELLQSVKL
jgi:colanic acid biosynthesis glycosyl transferase WcaI